MKAETRLSELLRAARDHWIAHHDAVLAIYAMPLDVPADDPRRPGLDMVRDYLFDNAPGGNGPLEREIKRALGEQ